MKRKHTDKIPDFKKHYFWIGMFFLFIQIIVVARNCLTNHFYFFWFCDFVPMLFALAFFLKKEQIAKAIINFGLLAQLYFFVFLINGKLSPELVFSPFLNLVYILASVFLHLSVILALILTYKTKPNLHAINFSIILIAAIYLITLIFTPPASNINNVYFQGGLIKFDIPYFTLLWPVLTFIFLVLPTHGIQYLLYRFSVRKSRRD